MRNFTVTQTIIKIIRYEQCSKQNRGLHKFSQYEILHPLYSAFSRLRQKLYARFSALRKGLSTRLSTSCIATLRKGLSTRFETFKMSAHASLTLEAAVSVPLFLMFCIALISFLAILNLQINIQVSMEETSRSMGKTAYALEHASSIKEKNSDSTDEQTLTMMSLGINPTTIKMWILSDNSLNSMVEQSRVKGGTGGLYTYNSTFDETDGILDIITSYDYQVPWVPSGWGTLRFVQRMRSHVWTGESLEKKSGGASDDSDGQTVYVTPTGSVYHLSASCHYLDLSIHSTSYSELSHKRNSSGARYDRCSECAASGDFSTVYITDYGTNWHSSLSCSGLKRTVVEHDISEVDGMRVCSKCKAQSAHE